MHSKEEWELARCLPKAASEARPRGRLFSRAGLTAVVVVLAGLVAAFGLWRRTSVRTSLAFQPRDLVLITRFENRTGEPTFDGAIEYALDDGSVSDEICYWRDMTLLPHLLNLFRKREIRSKCSFSLPKIRAGNRKEIARELRAEIVSMRS